jgi:putative membrane protein
VLRLRSQADGAILVVMPEADTAVRDRLAVTRTKLANERTLLAYVRTSVMLVASGATLWRFHPTGEMDRVLGIATIGVGIIVLAIGAWRFTRTHDRIEVDVEP